MAIRIAWQQPSCSASWSSSFWKNWSLWRHCHHDHCEAHDAHAPAHDHGRSGLLILVGDTFHNFVDGILIAAAFLENTELGIVTALAIIAHEIPQEVGDYLILLHSGYSKLRALAFNLLSSLATLVGAMLAYFALSEHDGMDPHRCSAWLPQA
jgi:zinc and cadmium transporter